MIKKTLIIALLFIFATGNTYALDTSTDTSTQKKQDTEQTQTLKKHKEQKESEGKKKSETETKSRDKQTQQAIKQIGQSMRQGGADVTIPLKALYSPFLVKLEETSEPFLTCKIITNPKLPADFGITSRIDSNTIDVIKAEFLSKAAQNNFPIKEVVNDDQAIKDYIKCIGYYGAIIANSYLYLTTDLLEIDSLQYKKGSDVKLNEDKDVITVTGLGYDDFMRLVESSFQKTLLTGLQAKRIKEFYELVKTADNCRFDKSVENIVCPPVSISLQGTPTLVIAGVHGYGSDSFMGFQGSYKLSRNWSYNDSIEKLKSISKYEKFANEVSKYTEELESQGRSKDATMVRKKAWEIAESGKQTVSAGKLLPNIH